MACPSQRSQSFEILICSFSRLYSTGWVGHQLSGSEAENCGYRNEMLSQDTLFGRAVRSQGISCCHFVHKKEAVHLFCSKDSTDDGHRLIYSRSLVRTKK